MSGNFRDFLKYLKESGKSESLKGGDFLRKAAALWKGKEYSPAKKCRVKEDCEIWEKCGVRGGCVRDRSYKKPKSPPKSPVKPKVVIRLAKYDLIRKRDRIVERLRTDPSLYPLMNGDGFVDITNINTYGLNQSQLECNELEMIMTQDKTFIRATYGWKGPIAYRILYGKYIPYTGRNRIFCLSHTSLSGLGDLNFGRRINVLDTPDRCPNKGVRGFVDVHEAMKKGLTFFSKVGDRYGNRIFSFDPELNQNFSKIEYVEGHFEEENIKKTYKEILDTYKKFMPEDKAIKMFKKLILESP